MLFKGKVKPGCLGKDRLSATRHLPTSIDVSSIIEQLICEQGFKFGNMSYIKDQTKGKGRGKSGLLNHEVIQRTTRSSSTSLPVIPLSTQRLSALAISIDLPSASDPSPILSLTPICRGSMMSGSNGRTRSNSKGASVGLSYPLNPNDRVHLTPINANVFVERGVTTTITCIIKKHFKGPWPTWRKVPSDVKELMWKTFQEYCKWNPRHNNKIKNVFYKTAKTRLMDMLADEKVKAMEEACVTNIKKCKGMEREWIAKDVWDALIDNEWDTDAWQPKSGKAKTNQLIEKKASITKHTCGLRLFAVDGIKLAEKLGREVGYFENFQVTHKRKGGDGEFVNKKSRVEKYNAALVDKYDDDISSHPSFDGQSWFDAIGGLNTTRTSVSGFGSRVDSRQLFSAPSTGPSTSGSACGPFTYQPFATNKLILQTQLEEKVKNLESAILGIQQGQASLQSKLDKILELLERKPIWK